MKSRQNSAAGLVVLLVLLVLVGTVGLGVCRLYVQHMDAYCAKLTVEGNRQTDVLAPFIQKNRLAQFPPDEALRSNFRSYLENQIAAKRLKRSDAERVLTELEKDEQALPIYTERGWVMPLIAKGGRL